MTFRVKYRRLAAGTASTVAAVLTFAVGAAPVHSQAPDQSSPSSLDGAITVDLVAPSEVRGFETLREMRVVVTNRGTEPLTMLYGGNLADFAVEDVSGGTLWRYLRVWNDVGSMRTLAPGESFVSRDGRWDLRLPNGLPVEPGTYRLKGIVTFSIETRAGRSESHVLETPAYDLIVRGAPVPEFARGLRIEVTAPEEARVGDTISMDARLTNTGEAPISFQWIGNTFPPMHYLDVAVFRDDVEIWRGFRAQDIRTHGVVTLEAGESRLLSDMIGGMPWMWDLRADCGRFVFEPCEAPVAQGVYTVRAMASAVPPEAFRQPAPYEPARVTVATPPHELRIVR